MKKKLHLLAIVVMCITSNLNASKFGTGFGTGALTGFASGIITTKLMQRNKPQYVYVQTAPQQPNYSNIREKELELRLIQERRALLQEENRRAQINSIQYRAR